MSNTNRFFGKVLLAAAVSVALPVSGFAENDLEVLRKEVDQLKKQMAAADEWKVPATLIHMAGYADVGYVKTDAAGDKGSYQVGTFAPIFHYQYRDLVMLESELEIEIGADGETEVKLEYLTIDWFINDYMVMVAGKFLSPIGQFRQNLHPSWINKMASAAPGFGHDGAAPVSDLGFQLRGGFHLGGVKASYAVYTGNGPEIKAEIEPDAGDSTIVEEIEFDGVSAEAFGADRDGEKIFGGRFGLLPMPSLEIGVSFLTGKATVTEFEGVEFTGINPSLDGVSASNYDVIGVDASWRNKNMDVRYEYVKTEVGETSIGGFGLAVSEWTTWYAQFAYKVPSTRYEVVVRYADFDSPHASKDRQQTVLGVNYLLASNFIGKLNFESNDNPNTGLQADNRWLIQLAYGF
jgi:hypothetical protein